MQRSIPKIKAATEKGYAVFLGKGFDTVVETFNVVMPDELFDRLTQAKNLAQESDKRGGGLSSVCLGAETLHIASHGGRGGCLFVLQHPDFSVDIRTPKMEWNITVRYSAAGLWQYGIEGLRNRVQKMITAECYPKANNGEKWIKLSCAHFAFDFYSPEFSAEMRPDIIGRIVCHSSSKKHANFSIKGNAWGRADYLETLTIGSKKSLEVQVYDKGKEITEASGKEWMLKVWEQEGYYPADEKRLSDIWRLEIRYGKEFLKNRQIDTFEDFCKEIKKLLTEALFQKRISVENEDSNTRRRPMHPLWAKAWEEAGREVKMLPIGKTLTASGDEMFEILRTQAAGVLRSMAVLKIGDCDETDMEVMAQRARHLGADDPDHEKKVEKLKERYRFMNTARG